MLKLSVVIHHFLTTPETSSDTQIIIKKMFNIKKLRG